MRTAEEAFAHDPQSSLNPRSQMAVSPEAASSAGRLVFYGSGSSNLTGMDFQPDKAGPQEGAGATSRALHRAPLLSERAHRPVFLGMGPAARRSRRLELLEWRRGKGLPDVVRSRLRRRCDDISGSGSGCHALQCSGDRGQSYAAGPGATSCSILTESPASSTCRRWRPHLPSGYCARRRFAQSTRSP